VAQVVEHLLCPEFKPQSCKKKKKRNPKEQGIGELLLT
jgi:hypothetical protein